MYSTVLCVLYCVYCTFVVAMRCAAGGGHSTTGDPRTLCCRSAHLNISNGVILEVQHSDQNGDHAGGARQLQAHRCTPYSTASCTAQIQW
jgi:hypothetical protein